jgi:membrane protein DedA with SNARE-associated domain
LTAGEILAHGEPLLRDYGYPALFACNLAEGVGIPLPGQTTLIAGAVLAGEGELRLGWILATALLASIGGNCAGYWIGRWGGQRLLRRLPVRAERLQKVESFVSRRGVLLVLAARFVDGLRQTVPLVAGSMGMHWWRFLAATTLGSAAWVALWGLGVYYLGREITPLLVRLHSVLEHPVWLIVAVLALVFGGLYLRPSHR